MGPLGIFLKPLMISARFRAKFYAKSRNFQNKMFNQVIKKEEYTTKSKDR